MPAALFPSPQEPIPYTKFYICLERVELAPNLASKSSGATIDAKLAIDDTEATVYQTEPSESAFNGSEFVVDLAGDKAVTSEDGTTWTNVLNSTFPAQNPRWVTPDLHDKGWDLATPVKAITKGANKWLDDTRHYYKN